jgi:hypothetical protein
MLGIPSTDVATLVEAGSKDLQMYRDRLYDMLINTSEGGEDVRCHSWATKVVNRGETLGAWYDTWSLSPTFLPMCFVAGLVDDLAEAKDCLCGNCTLDDGYERSDDDDDDDDDEGDTLA